jgi:hypothetical protein
MSIFEQATRKKLRFQSNRGPLTVENLWDLKLEDLDIIAISLKKSLRENEEESLIKPKRTSPETQMAYDVVKHIIETRLAEEKVRKDRATKNARLAQLEELLEKKQLTALEAKSEEEILKEIAELQEA